jgi:ribosomal protein S27E
MQERKYLGIGICRDCREEILYFALMVNCPECGRRLILYSFISKETLREPSGARLMNEVWKRSRKRE